MYILSPSRSLALLPFSIFLSNTCERLRHCRDDEKHRNDKSADTIDVMCSLRRYESIPSHCWRDADYASWRLQVHALMTDETFYCGLMKLYDIHELYSFRFPLFLVSVSSSLEIKFRYEKWSFLVGENTDINCTVSNVNLENTQNKSRFTWR